ncbi:hypothetical protein UY3_07887 [Chelonia mydas]|uniref:Uncharacterized protein n=1 Tax=Chelonia mydas TaxID=8469 RepID=M7BCQ0_CHEMY|nr:hypothetical protein UY3_07887 [Chelonia mydas]
MREGERGSGCRRLQQHLLLFPPPGGGDQLLQKCPGRQALAARFNSDPVFQDASAGGMEVLVAWKWKSAGGMEEVNLSMTLGRMQRQQIQELWTSYALTFSATPGLTERAYHSIDTGTGKLWKASSDLGIQEERRKVRPIVAPTGRGSLLQANGREPRSAEPVDAAVPEATKGMEQPG